MRCLRGFIKLRHITSHDILVFGYCFIWVICISLPIHLIAVEAV